MVSKVTDNMNLGVHVVAKNELGEDTCMIDVRTVDNNDEDNNNKNGDDDSGNEIRYAVCFLNLM